MVLVSDNRRCMHLEGTNSLKPITCRNITNMRFLCSSIIVKIVIFIESNIFIFTQFMKTKSILNFFSQPHTHRITCECVCLFNLWATSFDEVKKPRT